MYTPISTLQLALMHNSLLHRFPVVPFEQQYEGFLNGSISIRSLFELDSRAESRNDADTDYLHMSQVDGTSRFVRFGAF